MNPGEVINLLEANKNERGIQNLEKLSSNTVGLKSFGIGLTLLRKLSKKIGRDHSLAQQLWKSDIYDAKIIALLIDDPKQITRDQAELQVDNIYQGYFAHVFSSCDAPLAKTPFVVELLTDWINSNDTMRR
ncbi:MAG: DNA alkylation repair protein [Flavobacteriales bacterium]|nr:DNA alkylation repair protein [Flavobacteriales bacterium]